MLPNKYNCRKNKHSSVGLLLTRRGPAGSCAPRWVQGRCGVDRSCVPLQIGTLRQRQSDQHLCDSAQRRKCHTDEASGADKAASPEARCGPYGRCRAAEHKRGDARRSRWKREIQRCS